MSAARPSRRRAAAAFAAVGLAAGAVHVIAADAGDPRLWRETLPLAGVVGALLGAAVRPTGWFAGLLTAILAVPVFAFAYAVAETAIAASRGDVAGLAGWSASISHWTEQVLAQATVGAAAAILASAAAGFWLGRPRP